ncbi:molecular chaperone DnaJ [Candidatus Uhrbacteria bacterium]|nr:molecular chaperone DnaJ [Candidatus Uhrbacteria bacterium]
MAKDYYNILGITKSASQDEIKRAFRKLAHELHPDKGGDPKKFKEVNEAYQVLSDAEKRKQYDQYGTTFENAQAQGGMGGFEGFRDFTGFTEGMGVNFEDLGDLFGGMFGGGQSRSRSGRVRRGADIQADLKIAFRDAVFGIEKEVELWKTIACDRCHGKGAEPGSAVKKCGTCGGQGQMRQGRRTFLGVVETVVACDSCGGRGERIDTVCSKCRGGGVAKELCRVKVKVPAGIADGQTIRLTGEGEAGERGSHAGDLYLTVRVATDTRFERDGDDLHSEAGISFSQAALGATVDVETVDGVVALKIPAGTQAGQEFRLKGKGVAHLKSGGRGDHLVHVQVKTPKDVSRRQRDLLEQLQKEGV